MSMSMSMSLNIQVCLSRFCEGLDHSDSRAMERAGKGSLALRLSRAWPKKYLVNDPNAKTPTTAPQRPISPDLSLKSSLSSHPQAHESESPNLKNCGHCLPSSTLMVIARVASFFSSDTTNLADDGRKGSFHSDQSGAKHATPAVAPVVEMVEVEVDDEAARPPYLHVGAPYNTSPRFGRLLTAGYRQCWQEELAAQQETCSCTPSTQSRPGNRATHTCHQSIHPWETHTTQSGGKRG